jgi:hypothetical protein
MKKILLIAGLLAGLAGPLLAGHRSDIEQWEGRISGETRISSHSAVRQDGLIRDQNRISSTTVNGSLTVSGAATLSTNVTFSSTAFTTPSSVQSVRYATHTITTESWFKLIGSTGNITMTSAPTIATTTATNGQRMVLKSTAAAVTLQDKSVLANSQLSLPAASVAVSTTIAREFIFWTDTWYLIDND